MSGVGTEDDNEGVPAPSFEWQQCCVCRPNDPGILPPHIEYNAGEEFLLIATQTCSLCGPGAEPSFEVVVARPLVDFDPASSEAQGQKTRTIHLPLTGSDQMAGIALDVSRRAHLPSSQLQEMTPLRVTVPALAVQAFQGWIAKYYARIALPEALIDRLKKRQFFKRFERAMKHRLMDGLSSYSVRSDVLRVYIGWEPDRELPGGEEYHVGIVIICKKPQTVKYLLDQFTGLASGVKGAQSFNGLVMDDPDVQLLSEASLESTFGKRLYAAIDELSAYSE